MKSIEFVYSSVGRIRVFSRSLMASCAVLTALTILAPSQGCKKNDVELEHGAGQVASAQEREQQNRNLIDQVVSAAEAQEKYPDPTYLRGALGRLNTWLAERPISADFAPDPEYDELHERFAELAAAVIKGDDLVRLFLDDTKTPVEKDCNDLQATLLSIKSQLDPLAETLKSNTLASFSLFVAELSEKLNTAREFQFADPTESFQTQIRQFAANPGYEFFNLSVLRSGVDDFNRLLKLDGQVFLPQDADYLRSVVWFRDVFNWAKGAKQDDMLVVKALCDWTVKNIVLADPIPGPAEPIAQLDWQTLLLGQGTPTNRAIVFIELLRQYRLDAFVLRPDRDDVEGFPVVVGVALNNEVYLFDMQSGLPFPADAPDALALEEKTGLVVNKVATLAEVAGNDAILRKFDLANRPYNATAKDFEKVVAYVPSTPFHVAARMIPMEQEFSGAVNTVLSTPFDLQKERILANDGIADVKRLHEATAPILEQAIFPSESEFVTRVFMLPLESSGNLEVSGDKNSNSSADDIADYTGDSTSFGEDNVSGKKKSLIAPLWIGKILYLRGRFVDDSGAAHWFLQGRVSERVLKQQESNIGKLVQDYVTQYQEWAASQNQPVGEEELQALVEQTVLSYRLEIATKRYVKTISSYNLAILSDANGDDDAAMDRLNDESIRYRRVERLQLGDELRNAGNYLRARILERQGAWASAVARYRAGMDFGSYTRANWIAELAGIAAEAPAVEEPAADAPAVEEPAADATAVEEPADDATAVEEPADDVPAVEEPADDVPAVEEPAADVPAVEEPAADVPAVEEPAA